MDWIPLVLPVLLVVASFVATLHVLLHKEEPRAAIGWIGLMWLAPAIGIGLYVVLGINRIQRKAVALRGGAHLLEAAPSTPGPTPPDRDLLELEALAHLGGALTHRPLLGGNRVELLQSGDEAYPAMLEAIAAATSSITLASYIFDRDPIGEQFVEALSAAVERGVQVRVLIDALGARYSWPTILPTLRRRNIPFARFLPARPWSVAFLNLRSHRKVCVVDGRTAFTGGMNIRIGHVIATQGDAGTRDVHARVEGPVVGQLQAVFAEDWAFSAAEQLEGDRWFPPLVEVGDVHARAIPDGPDAGMDAARLTFLGGLAVARRSVRIVTPYFLPDEALSTALLGAAMRGVEVDVVVPARTNQPLVQWAANVEVERVLERGVRVWASGAPFDHSKLLVVDGQWTVIGSANWDPRSLRLNFELLLEVYGEGVASQAEAVVADRIGGATPVTLDRLRQRSALAHLRDHTARLFKPYL
jgi:cardiolipin synthase